MQKKFFRPLGTLFCSALLLGALTVPAMAANDISVKVDDQPVSFTDASPIRTIPSTVNTCDLTVICLFFFLL